MRGRRLEKTGSEFAGIRCGFFGAENDADSCGSFAAVEWHDSDRLLGTPERLPILLPDLHRSKHIDRKTDGQLSLGFIRYYLFVKNKCHRF